MSWHAANGDILIPTQILDGDDEGVFRSFALFCPFIRETFFWTFMYSSCVMEYFFAFHSFSAAFLSLLQIKYG